jgi:hypothetical protein
VNAYLKFNIIVIMDQDDFYPKALEGRLTITVPYELAFLTVTEILQFILDSQSR